MRANPGGHRPWTARETVDLIRYNAREKRKVLGETVESEIERDA